MTEKPFAKKTETIEIRIAPGAKRSFLEKCERNETSASAVLRELMDVYVSAGKRASTKAISQEFYMFNPFRLRVVRWVAVVGAVLTVGSVPAFPAAADPRVQAFFLWFDGDGDNSLSMQELFSSNEERATPPGELGIEIALTSRPAFIPDASLPREQAMEQIFALIDSNGDGRISLQELEDGVEITTRLSEPILAADQDGDGKVTAAELAAHITAQRAAAGDSRPAIGAALLAEGLIRAHDRSGDGKLEAADFGT